MYIYLLLAILTMVFLGGLFSGKQGNSKENSRGRQNSGGGLSPCQRDLCEVSGHDHFFSPSSPRSLTHLLTLLVGDLCLAKLGLWETTQVRRKYGLSSPVLRKNLCASPTTEVQVPVLQCPWKVCVQRILWTCARQVTPRLFLYFLHR